MKTWITLLRGVNVGGHNKLPMAEFREMLGAMGYDRVATYIQSGNAVFRAGGSVPEISGAVSAVLMKRFGISADVIVLAAEDMDHALRRNPFNAGDDPKTLHLFFLADAKVRIELDAIRGAAKSGEECDRIGGVFYFYTPEGFGKSDLATKLGRLIKTPITGRNLRSCMKIRALAAGLADNA